MKSERFNPNIVLDHASLIPLRTQIIDSFRREIIRHRLASGTKIVSERQLAEELQINRNTVHQAYEQLTRDGLLADSNQGSFKEISTQAAVHYRIAFPMLNLILSYKMSEQLKLDNPHALEIVGGIIDKAADLSISVNFMALPDLNLPLNRIKEYFERYLPHSIGYISLGARISEFDPVFAELLSSKTLPHVFVSGRSELPHISSVAVDLAPSVNGMLKYLKVLGHRKLGIIGIFHSKNHQFVNVAVDRGNFIKNLAPDYGVRTVVREISFDSSFADARAVTRSMFSNPKEGPTALWVHNDEIALEVIDELAGMNLRVPSDVLVIGYDNISKLPNLATIDHSRVEIGGKAVEIVHQIFNYGSPGEAMHVTVPSKFLPKQSYAKPQNNKKAIIPQNNLELINLSN